MVFRNRTEAGRYLASRLEDYANRPDALVLALPRGGVTTLLRCYSAVFPEMVDGVVLE